MHAMNVHECGAACSSVAIPCSSNRTENPQETYHSVRIFFRHTAIQGSCIRGSCIRGILQPPGPKTAGHMHAGGSLLHTQVHSADVLASNESCLHVLLSLHVTIYIHSTSGSEALLADSGSTTQSQTSSQLAVDSTDVGYRGISMHGGCRRRLETQPRKCANALGAAQRRTEYTPAVAFLRMVSRQPGCWHPESDSPRAQVQDTCSRPPHPTAYRA